MCTIIDNDVVHQLFGVNPTEAGVYFLRWLTRRNGGIVVAGGRLFRELAQNPNFLRFFTDRLQAGRARRIADIDVNIAEEVIRAQAICRSNDVHILALARVSGARLLFTNDGALKQDFTNPDIIAGTLGRVYSTNRGRQTRRYAPQEVQHVTRAHQDVLRRTDLCHG